MEHRAFPPGELPTALICDDEPALVGAILDRAGFIAGDTRDGDQAFKQGASGPSCSR
jgi:hypothetical protein